MKASFEHRHEYKVEWILKNNKVGLANDQYFQCEDDEVTSKLLY